MDRESEGVRERGEIGDGGIEEGRGREGVRKNERD